MPTAKYWIVLDTSTVRETVRGNAALGIDLAALAVLRGRAVVALADRVIKLTNQLRNQEFTFGQW